MVKNAVNLCKHSWTIGNAMFHKFHLLKTYEGDNVPKWTNL